MENNEIRNIAAAIAAADTADAAIAIAAAAVTHANRAAIYAACMGASTATIPYHGAAVCDWVAAMTATATAANGIGAAVAGDPIPRMAAGGAPTHRAATMPTGACGWGRIPHSHPMTGIDTGGSMDHVPSIRQYDDPSIDAAAIAAVDADHAARAAADHDAYGAMLAAHNRDWRRVRVPVDGRTHTVWARAVCADTPDMARLDAASIASYVVRHAANPAAAGDGDRRNALFSGGGKQILAIAAEKSASANNYLTHAEWIDAWAADGDAGHVERRAHCQELLVKNRILANNYDDLVGVAYASIMGDMVGMDRPAVRGMSYDPWRIYARALVRVRAHVDASRRNMHGVRIRRTYAADGTVTGARETPYIVNNNIWIDAPVTDGDGGAIATVGDTIPAPDPIHVADAVGDIIANGADAPWIDDVLAAMSPAQIRIIRWIAAGASNATIARRLRVSPATASRRVRAIRDTAWMIASDWGLARDDIFGPRRAVRGGDRARATAARADAIAANGPGSRLADHIAAANRAGVSYGSYMAGITTPPPAATDRPRNIFAGGSSSIDYGAPCAHV